MEKGILGVAEASRGYLIALYGSDQSSLGFIRGRLESLSSYFSD